MMQAFMMKALEGGALEGLKKQSFDMPKFFNQEMKSETVKDFKEADKSLFNTDSLNNYKKEDIDDRGRVFKEDGKLLANNSFEVNGYQYETDDKGRTVSAEGVLKLDESQRKTINEDNVGGYDKRDTDDRGHLIADRFGGSNKIENLVPMDANLNRGDFKKIENSWAEALQEGKDVKVKVEPFYEGDSKRPTSFDVSYSINGDERVAVFMNERRGI